MSITCSSVSAPASWRADFVQGLRALLANLRFPCLLLEAGGQLPDDQGGRQHHGEGHQILDVADGQRKARRHEKYVEQQYAQDGRQHGGAAPEADRDQQHREQEEHHDVGEVETAEQGRAQFLDQLLRPAAGWRAAAVAA
jgi:hypothetical protein